MILLNLSQKISSAFLWLLMIAPVNAADEVVLSTEELFKLDISELMNIKVISVAKKSQKLSQSAAAVFVISQDDIRRSGATTIADALRMVPGLQVAKYNSHSWAVTSRGFNGYYANKLLVLIDGRSMYTPEFSGVYWDSVDTLLDDVERIEVIRGPGGTLWGANAVNGVINIITKSAQDTTGELAIASIGDEEKGSVQFRHGGTLGSDGKVAYRVYAKTAHHDDLPTGFYGNFDYKDSWYRNQAGFRIDGRTDDNKWTLQGDVYHSGLDEANYSNSAQTGRVPVRGWNVLGRWQRQLSNDSDISAQWYYDYYKRSPLKQGFSNRTIDFELQHRFQLGQHHEILWGGGYRFQDNYVENKPGVSSYEPETRQTSLFNLFVQDEIQLVPDVWRLTVGTKFEHNAFTGLEIQPNLRLLWNPTDKYSIWAAISQAVRTPSRSENDEKVNISITGRPTTNPFYPEPMQFSFIGITDLKAETLLAYELGIHAQMTPHLSWDLATFYNRYDDLIVFDQDMLVENRILFKNWRINGMYGHSYGAELALDWQPLDAWRLSMAYTFFDMQLEMDAGVDPDWKRNEDKSPHNQLSLRSQIILPHHWQFDVWLRYIGEIDVPLGLYRDGGVVKAYTTLDARLAWQMSKQVELSIVGQNLLDEHFMEFPVDPYNPLVNQVQRGVYGQLRWQF